MSAPFNNSRGRSRWMAIACGFALLAACESTPRGSQNHYEGAEGESELVRIEPNRALRNQLVITNPIHQRVDERLKVQFQLENRYGTEIKFSWTIDWFDQQGFQVVDARRHWEPVSLDGYGTKVLTVVAPTPGASSWKLQVSSRSEVK